MSATMTRRISSTISALFVLSRRARFWPRVRRSGITCLFRLSSHLYNTRERNSQMFVEPVTVVRAKISLFTYLGLFISLFGFILLRLAFRAFGTSTSAGVWKEFAVWLSAALLLVLVRYGERLPFSSLGPGVAPLRQSLRFGCILAGLCGV